MEKMVFGCQQEAGADVKPLRENKGPDEQGRRGSQSYSRKDCFKGNREGGMLKRKERKMSGRFTEASKEDNLTDRKTVLTFNFLHGLSRHERKKVEEVKRASPGNISISWRACSGTNSF